MKFANTCEEYVLNELEKARNDVIELAEIGEKLVHIAQAQDALLRIIAKRMKIRKATDGSRIVSTDLIFEEFDKEDFEQVERLLTKISKEENAA